MEAGDLVWMRSPQGLYHLCRVSGAWKYMGDEIHRNLDIVNTRPVEILEVGLEDNVPGQIVNSFIPSRTLQRINGQTSSDYSQYLWDQTHSNPLPETFMNANIFDLLNPFECEDLVSIYLQSKGYIVYFPPTKRTAIAYEYVVCSKDRPHKIHVVQVKMGGASININELPGRSFAFQTNGQYHGSNSECTIIERDTMVAFLKGYKNILPRRIQNFIEWIGIEKLR